MARSNKKVLCEWCFGEADLPRMYIPESPVLEFMEQKLIKIGGHFDGTLSKWEEWEISCYDEMVKSIRKGNVCTKCWTEDQRLYEKYYEKGDGESGIMLF